jgi:tetratricopeptide (TPR) repeat protein
VCNVEFLGFYATRDDSGLTAFHKIGESGLWQVWRAQGDIYILQALDAHRRPQGGFFSVSADDFFYALIALPKENIVIAPRHFIRSDSPHLLEAWLDQMQAAQEGAERPEAALGILPEEAKIFPLVENTGPWRPAAGSGGKDTPRQRLFSVDAPPETSAGASGAAQAAFSCPALSQDLPEQEKRIASREALLRDQFAILLARLDTPERATAEAELARLLGEEEQFTWKQKYMFAELGMALRRKGQTRLARKAHLRALSLAPEDGHILFNLARSEYEMGNIAEAKAYLSRVLTSLPGFDPALKFLAFLDGREQP